MKRISILMVFGLLGTIGLTAQHETLFSRARVVGGFGGPIFEYGINNNLGTSIGGGGAVVINSFFLGGYGLGSVDFNEWFDTGDIERLEIGHGGFWFGGTFKPHKVLHLYGSARIGWGVVDVKFNDNNQRFSDVDQIFVATPELGIELNIFRWFRLAGAVGYRWVDGTSSRRGYTNSDFSGAIGSITLRFGGFGSKNW